MPFVSFPLLLNIVKLKIPTKAAWDDEVDEAENDLKPVVAAGPTAAMIEAAAKKAKDEEEALANKLKFAQLENESADQRRARERKCVEEADNELTGDLFGVSAAGKPKTTPSLGSGKFGLGGIPVSTKADHTNFGILCAKKIENSTSFNIAAFYESFTSHIHAKLSIESLDKIIADFQKIRNERDERVAKKVDSKKSKAAIKSEKKKHEEVFGGSRYDDPYEDRYGHIEDDYM